MFTYISSKIDEVDLKSDTDFPNRKDTEFHNGKERIFFPSVLSQAKM